MFLDTPLCFERFVSFLACDAACRCSANCSKSICSNWMASRASFADGVCSNLCHAFFVVCNLFHSVSNLCCRLSILLSFRQTSHSQPPAHVFILRLPSLQSTWLLQLSLNVCCTSCFFRVTPFHTSSAFVWLILKKNRFFNSAAFYFSQLQSPLHSQLGVDDFQYQCLSSSVQLETLFSSYVSACCWLCS